MTNTNTLIQGSGIWRIFNKESKVPTTALREANFKIERGEMIAVTGPSGSGKSTFLSLLGLLDQPSYGDIYFGNKQMQGLCEKEIEKIRLHKVGFVFQDFQLLNTLTVRENIEYFLYRQGIESESRSIKVGECLKLVDLWEKRNSKPSELSGGQKQRVAIARAIAKSPDIIIADEPTASLDSRTGQRIMDIFKRLNESCKMTVVMATHDPSTLKYVDRIMHIYDGYLTVQAGGSRNVI